MLKWTVAEIADRAQVSPNTVTRVEADRSVNTATLKAIQAAYEHAGIHFRGNDCVCRPGRRNWPVMPIDASAAPRNVLQLLQQEPQRYKLFGVYWPAVKTLLKDEGYGPDQLYMLGDYRDPAILALLPRLERDAMLEAAFADCGQNARYPHPDGTKWKPRWGARYRV